MNRVIILLALPALLILAACGGSVDTSQPPEIAYGQDVCERCGMIISEEKFASAYWTEEGEARRFDDIGGMLAYISEEHEEVASYWVHDLTTGGWIRAEDAFFVVDGELMTPMGFGIAAFEDETQAQAMAHGQEGVMVMAFPVLLDKNIMMPADLHESSMAHEDQSE